MGGVGQLDGVGDLGGRCKDGWGRATRRGVGYLGILHKQTTTIHTTCQVSLGPLQERFGPHQP